MILTPDQAKQLYSPNGYYECDLVKQRFGYSFFRDEVSPLGNIICFTAPTQVGPLVLKNALVIACELPNTNIFGGVCFQRLYSARVGTIISEVVGKDCYVDEGCLICDNKQISLSLVNRSKDSILFHNIIALETDFEEMGTLDLGEEQLKALKEQAIISLNYLLKSIFIESQRDNF